MQTMTEQEIKDQIKDARIQAIEDIIHAMEESGSYNAEDIINIAKYILAEEMMKGE